MSKCRSCGAEIEWAVTAAGKRMPLEPATTKANIVIERGVARVVEPGQGHYLSHHATCKDAKQWRRT